MNRSETAQALAVAAAYDNRTIGESNVMAWSDALSDLRLADVVAAIKLHYRASEDFAVPSRIRTLVNQIRSHRIADALIPAPPFELADDPMAALDWQREVIRRIGDGEDVDQPELRLRVMPPLDGVFKVVPPG